MLITAYGNRMRLASLRPETVYVRLGVLRAFEATLGDHRDITTATRLDVEAFLARDLKPESRRAYRGHLRAFYLWAIEEGYLTVDPTDRLPTVRVPRAVPRPIQPDDLRRAVQLASPRMRAWLLLMSLAGLRCIEVAALRPEDVSTTDSGPLLFLRECKGGGTATVPAHEAVLAALAHLPSRNGLWWTCTPRHVSKHTNHYLRDVGVAATAHQLRHRAGTDWYEASGHDLLTTMRLLRHATVASTQVYAEVSASRPAEVVRLTRAAV